MESTSGEGEGGHEIELSGGNWQTVVIPVTEALMTTAFSTRTTYTLRGLQAGAVYDVVAKAKNKFGWSDQSKTFNFFNKGVGKSFSYFQIYILVPGHLRLQKDVQNICFNQFCVSFFKAP